MLRELHIRNLALIEELRVELSPGLNVFTGQTGAGKSLVLGAFELLLGKRASADMLRPGAAEGRVTGIFDILTPALRSSLLAASDLDPSAWPDGEGLLLQRRIADTGRSSAAIAGQPVTLDTLRRVGDLLIDMHTADDAPASAASGSADSQRLLRPAHQLDLLDQFAALLPLRDRCLSAFADWRALVSQRDAILRGSALRSEQLDLYRFQIAEIDAVAPTEGEFEELSARFRILSALEKILRQGAHVQRALEDGDESPVSRIRYALALLRELAEIDPALAEACQLTQSAGDELSEALFTLSRYLSRQDLNPAELGEVTDRLNALNRLISKYAVNGSLADVLAFRADLAARISALEQGDAGVQDLSLRIDAAYASFLQCAQDLHAKRLAAVKRLKPLVESELALLAMPQASFDVDLAPLADPSSTGLDRVEFMLSANPGSPLRPLRLVASGGELSRVMLALKTLLADAQGVSVLIFDEIDAKIGGRLGDVIGSKLRALARSHQVLCITHLPQIAAYADAHFKIEKSVTLGRTSTALRRLDVRSDVIRELAEMLAGANVTPTALAQASELLDRAHEAPPPPTVSSRPLAPAARKPRASSARARRPSPRRSR